MSRNAAREIAMHMSYELSFTDLSPDELLDCRLSESRFAGLAPEYEIYGELPSPEERRYIRRVVKGVAEHGFELDQYIDKYAVGWRFERIPLVAAAIMRLAMFEILYMPDIPDGAAINEAVKLTKKYEEPDIVRFVNGILGTFIKKEAAVTPPQMNPAPAGSSSSGNQK
ncbi:MAG: transcription antitermination factor NusB [Oscillospiraceae bacterium]|nr:transcription antitermination factor NusB [Oscillospiraceae bacterium]